MNLSDKEIERVLDGNLEEAVKFLCGLIKFPSTRGNEGQVNKYIYSRVKPLCDEAKLIQVPASFSSYEGYSWPAENINYSDIQNVRFSFIPKKSAGKSLILNAHSDVVPPSKNHSNAFNPKLIDNIVYGRGACDDKGQIAVIYLLLKCLSELKIKPASDVSIDIVIEEENGGNGTLLAIQDQMKADAAIVLEPSELKILPSVRGAVWFEVKCTGKAAHSGSEGKRISALDLAVEAIDILKDYHKELLQKSRGINRLFDEFEDPMPLTFGILNAGDWPATVPAVAILKGVFGFLPNVSVDEVRKGMTEALENNSGEWLKEHFEITFNMLNNEGNQIDEKHPLVETLTKALSNAGIYPEISAMTAACDAWQYVHRLNVPTVVIGAGSLGHAHSNMEQIKVDDIKNMAKTLLYFIKDWCGFEEI